MLATIDKYKTVLLGDKDYKELIHGVGISAGFTLGGMALGYVVTILSARWFGAEGMGLMAMMNTVIVFAGAVAGIGIQGSVVRYINQWKAQGHEGRLRTLHWYILKTVLPFSICIAIALFFARGWLANTVFGEPLLEELFFWLAVCFPLIVLGNIGMEMIKGYKDLITYHSINKIGKLILKAIVIGGVRWTTQSIYGPAWAMLATASSASLFALPFLWKRYRSLPEQEEISRRDILKTSLPMMVTSISAVIMNQTDIVMLGMYTDTTEVGVYQVAMRMAVLVPFGLLMVNMIIGQKIAELYYSRQKEKLQNLLKIGATISTIIGLIAAILFSVFAKQFMGFFGSDFVNGAILLQTLVIGQFINAFAGSAGLYLNMTGKQNILQYTVLGTGIINIALNLLLINKYGAKGVAISSALCYALNNIIQIYTIYKIDKIKITM